MANRHTRSVILLVMLVAFAFLKADFNPSLGRYALDGDYYYGIARYVAKGEGLLSNLSLYHQGFKTFPHHVTQSPLWPLLLGHVGGWFGLDRASTWLPEILYLVDLLLIYFLANRLWNGISAGVDGFVFRGGRILNFGHFSLFLLGTSSVFFTFTSLPYTESLAFLFLFGGLLALDRAALEGSMVWAWVFGLLAGLALLTRPQMLVLGIVAPLVLACSRPFQGSGPRLAITSVLGSVAALLPWSLYLATWMDPITWRGVLGLATLRETPQIAPFEHTVLAPGLGAYVADRLGGLLIAFDPRSSQSYVRHVSWLVYLVPIAGLQLAGRWLGSGVALPNRLDFRWVLPVTMVLCGVGMLLPVHLLHMAFSTEWLFGHRQGLAILLLVLPAIAYLDTHTGRFLRFATALVLATSLLLNGLALRRAMQRTYTAGITEVGQELVAWLDAQDPLPVVVTAKSHKLSIFSDSGFHWALCSSTPESTLDLLRYTGADYLLVFPAERKCNFLRGLRPDSLTLVETFGTGGRVIQVMKLKVADAAAHSPSSAPPETEGRPAPERTRSR